MTDNPEIRTISFDQPDEIVAAIHRRETFEVGGCHGRMSEAVQFVERAIGGEGLSSRVYTKGRLMAMAPAALLGAPLALAAAVGMAAHHVVTLNPDYEIMKRLIDQALRVSYVKNEPGLAAKAMDAASLVGQGVSDAARKTASAASDAAVAFGQGVADAAEKTTSAASDAANSVAEAWEKHAPSKEVVVGSLVVGGVGSLVLNGEELATIGARTMSHAAKTASAVSDAASNAASVAKDNPGAVVVGAAVGVVAVAAAPFTGGGSLFGAAALTASLAGTGGVAAGAALIGASAGAAISNAQTKKITSTAFGAGVEKEKAESAVKIEQLSNMMVHAAEVYAAQARLNEFIVSLAAVGYAMAACDGPVAAEEQDCIEEYVIGVSRIALPQSIRDRLSKIASSPPDFERAVLYVQNFDHDIWSPIDHLLEVISEADGDMNQSEQNFLEKWENHKIAAIEEASEK
jgi:hypothetical protein